ncbi:putative E3 ubiquitin protein ligase RIE1 [Iris pallida]|uniref:E3 ubiquitin protein ligase RIE1 n=1 Tax=Iris pallida TaxID=29817 RepID=A0AAX6H5V3_IRIPA|nr:putative E3 ubiquitin protein ligase RIE1 [Iris pallida]
MEERLTVGNSSAEGVVAIARHGGEGRSLERGGELVLSRSGSTAERIGVDANQRWLSLYGGGGCEHGVRDLGR